MIKSEKLNKVNSIKEEFLNNNGLFFTDHSNIKSDQSVVIRDKLYEVDATLMILKNTLASIAASESFKDLDLSNVFKGPTSVIVSHKDLIATAKVLKDIIKEYDLLKIKAGIIDGKLVSANEINMLANLPSREILISQVVCAIAGPLSMLVNVLNNLPQKLVMTLSAIQKEKAN
ncbi:MAG: 50S ribosomal protein L10 [Actinobacteria bacterium]|nr:50S ribosomal protein L10 [Actinomycetota bacterium]MCL5770741.1 50S ribosomal protein L10 [Actinomycetota bacterium]